MCEFLPSSRTLYFTNEGNDEALLNKALTLKTKAGVKFGLKAKAKV